MSKELEALNEMINKFVAILLAVKCEKPTAINISSLNNILRLEFHNELDIIETALKRNVELEKENETLKSIKFIVADDMPAEEKLNKINGLKFLCQDISPMKIEPLYDEKTLKKLKAFEIIKEKRVNVGNLIYWFKSHNTYEEYRQDCYQEGWYLHYKDNNDNRCKFWKLTQEEYDLLKEVLL